LQESMLLQASTLITAAGTGFAEPAAAVASPA
jgi:hypothetical protein